MLVELRDVEVYVEPQEILTKALEEGDLSVDTAVRECIINDGVDEVLKAINNSDLTDYCERHELMPNIDFYAVATHITTLNQDEKAKLLWLLLTSRKDLS